MNGYLAKENAFSSFWRDRQKSLDNFLQLREKREFSLRDKIVPL
jgi:hypothetical protein